jgi:hypothetical protein
VSLVFAILAVNCCVPEESTLEGLGVSETEIGGVTVTCELAEARGSATLVAFTLTMVFVLTVGAV